MSAGSFGSGAATSARVTLVAPVDALGCANPSRGRGHGDDADPDRGQEDLLHSLDSFFVDGQFFQ